MSGRLTVRPGFQGAEVERIVGLGATVHEDHRGADGRGWVTLLDPAGNEFCVERGEAEHAG